LKGETAPQSIFKMARFFLAGLAAMLMLLVNQAAAACAGVTSRFTPKMGTGYKANVIATGLRTPRGIATDSEGNLLVVEQQGGGVKRLVMEEQADGTVCVKSSAALITGGTVSDF
jgi:glucose/arabinose dehydrogenase